MIKMGITEAKRKYNNSHFGNEPCEIGNTVYIIENDEQGLHEALVEVIADEINIVVFEIKSKISNHSWVGELDLSTADDDEPHYTWYNENGDEIMRMEDKYPFLDEKEMVIQDVDAELRIGTLHQHIVDAVPYESEFFKMVILEE